MRKIIVCLVLTLIFSYAADAKSGEKNQERPNFLFLVIEDTSPYLLPPYGNEDIKTPNLDFLAKNGVVFSKAYSNGPQCSPARSSLISGSYSTTYGNDWHRNPHIVPGQYFFPQYLREAGYFTVNAGKTDYNVTKDVRREFYPVAWDKMSGYQSKTGKPNASYNDEERNGRPFFAQFNNMTTHMSRMTSVSVENREASKLNPDSVNLPPHVPDLPDVRADYALHLDGVSDADKWVGYFIEDLKEKELFENTIIFFFSDHGGCLPRGKAFGYNTGYQAGLIISAPPKWQHLLPEKPGSVSERIVEFADFGPTLLSAAGVEPPDHLQGKPFMGEHETEEREYGFCFRTNTEDHFDPSRSAFSKKFQYIKFYTPYKIHALRQSFQWGMPAQLAWDSLFLAGKTKPQHRQYYEPKPREMLFDMEKDPYCLNNLADDPEYFSALKKHRKQVFSHVRETKDLGFFPRDVRDDFVRKGISLYEWIREEDYPLDSLYDLVERASWPSIEDVDYFSENLSHSRPEMRFWAASGLAYLFQQGHFSKVPVEGLKKLLNDDFPSVSAHAAMALVYCGMVGQGMDTLLGQAADGNSFAWSAIENLGALAQPYVSDIAEIAEHPKNRSVAFSARSVLINFGELTMKDLIDDKAEQNFIKNQKNRIEHWAPTLP
ncbi:sulfatase family protein [Marinilabilia rubra]|uniref:Sulfatase n=1 Tax=Marinilabilia rubra TaxID=2162893 RepID=A0A2U2BEC6_9BACT|nr:sulfatase [Marinilabilia rubra]PWE01383.1 sulfatase [Marinilabilia rubra]